MIANSALVIVDVQNDFCPGGTLAVPNGDEVVGPINDIIREWRWNRNCVIVGSRDWHPEVTSHFKKDGGIWPVHCVKDTPGAMFHPKLIRSHWWGVFSKGTKPNEDAYSAFDGENCDSKTTLGPVLSILDVQEVFVCGLATDYCVKATVLDSIKQGFKTYLVEDACRAVNLTPVDGIRAIKEMVDAGAILVKSETIIGGF